MNLKDDRMEKTLSEALDALMLSQKNRRLAEEYLEQPEGTDEGLLKETEYQEFSQFTETERAACFAWCKELRELAGAEALVLRYAKFVTAVGKSSAYYVLVKNGNRDMEWLAKALTIEQRTAFRAEMYAYASHTLEQGSLSVLVSTGKKDPEALLRAGELCCGPDDAPRMLLEAEYLYCMTLVSVTNERTEEVSGYLEQRILKRLPELFTGKVLSETELSALRDYVRKADVDGAFPAEILTVLQGTKCQEYMLALLAGCAYLALEQKKTFGAFLRLAAAAAAESGRSGYQMGRDRFFTVSRYTADRDWFHRHIRFLIEKMPIEQEWWVEWSLRTREESVWQYMMKEYPEAIKKAAEKLELSDYERLLERVQKIKPAWRRELFDQEQYRRKVAQELVTNFKTEEETAKKYFLGEASLEQVLPLVKEWRKTGSGYYGNKDVRLKKLQKDPQMRQMYRRALVMEGLLMHGTYFRFYMFGYDSGGRMDLCPSAAEIDEIFKVFQEEQMPASCQLDVLSCIHESCYRYDSTGAQDHFTEECVQALDARIGQWGEAYKKAAVNGAAMTRIFCIRTMDLHGEEYKEALLSCAGDSSRQVQQVLVEIYKNHPEWEPQIKAMLASRKQKERQMAVWVLKQWGVDRYRLELSQALEQEKNAKLSEYLKKLLGSELDVDLEQLVKELLKGSRRQKVQWAFTKPFDMIHMKNGAEAPEDYLRAILVAYAYMEPLGIHKDAVRLADALQKAELSACMAELFQRWLDYGAEAKKRWVLYAVSIHGGEAVIPLLLQQIKELPAKFRGALAVDAVKALALNGSSPALLLVDQISRKCRYRQVKKGAAEALAGAAAEFGISQEELEDRIVPDLGFHGEMEQTFDYGARTFTVRLSPALETEVYGPDGKRLKNMPAPGKQDDPEKAKEANLAFKQMKKQLKTVAASQKLRFSQALLTGRFWQAGRWQELFVKNPVMHQFAAGLIWGRYEDGVLQETFRYMEDGSFNTVKEEEYAFPEEGTIGLIHPIELSEADLAAWKEQLSDYEITQPIEQLSRPVHAVTDEEAAETTLTRFRGVTLNGLSLSGKLLAQGWNRGPVGDGGAYRAFYREDGDMGVNLSFSGCGITYENVDVTVYEAAFYRPCADTDGGGGKEKCFLGEISPRYFSEIVLQIAAATKSGQEKE